MKTILFALLITLSLSANAHGGNGGRGHGLGGGGKSPGEKSQYLDQRRFPGTPDKPVVVQAPEPKKDKEEAK